jgi:hypothetical protein
MRAEWTFTPCWLANQDLPGLYPVFAQEQNEPVRVVATRIEWDGTMQRGMVDTGHCGGGPQWEDLTARALAVPPPYRPFPAPPSTTSAWMTAR